MKRVWTENQQKAIDARGKQVLVSAAAGSGKTAVLTERVKNILCDSENKCSADEILVVTFTKAAAGEMRERTSKALKEEIKNNPSQRARLKNQLTLLQTADISTMDAFCSKIVKENFHLADISADFTLLDDNDHEVLKDEVLKEVLDELYEKDEENLKKLSSFFVSDKDDRQLEEVIKKLHRFSMSYPSPENWLNTVTELFNPKIKIENTLFAEELFSYFENYFDYYKKAIEISYKKATEGVCVSDEFSPYVQNALNNLDVLLELCRKRNWDELYSCLASAPIVKYPRISAKLSAYKQTNTLLKSCSEGILKFFEKGLPDTKENKADMEILFPIVNNLADAIKLFSKRLLERKKEENSYYFDDILHKCIDILVQFNSDGTVEKTEIANELSLKYKEILIDEYQDTNEAQNIIFQAISRNKTNFYCVGDVKQSIYRFRLASPQLFMDLKDELPVNDDSEKGIQIILEKNFRSRKGVTECVNFIFSKLMTREMGEIDYNENEFLYCGADYPLAEQPSVELHLLDLVSLNSEEIIENEALYIAKYIKETVENKSLVKDGDVQRPAEYSDFAILLRASKSKAAVFAEGLSSLGIPSVFENNEVVSESKEIMVLTSLIKAISNPLIDIPLVSVMMSSLFGFSAEEIAEIRLINRKADIYTCLLEYAKSNKKAERFLRKLDFYRNMSLSYPIYDFVKLLIDDTAINEVFLSTENGEERLLNIKSILNCAKTFTENGKYGLSAFIRYLDSFIDNSALKKPANAKSNGVKIMSIHKSKGLEFPFVILADCSKGANFQDSYGKVTVSRETGLGVKIRDDERFTLHGTLSSFATEKVIQTGDISEELRILYVALTRAKEHLVFICSFKSEKDKENISGTIYLTEKETDKKYLHPYDVFKAKNYTDWICSSLLLHPDAKELRRFVDFEATALNDAQFDLTVKIASSEDIIKEDEASVSEEFTSEINHSLLEQIKEKADYIYPYDDLSGVLAKRTASSVEKHISNKQFFASEKPRFMGEKITGADRGTAVHKFLELCDFSNAEKDLDVEINRLISEFLLTETEINALDKSAVTAFLGSDVGKRLLASEKVLKEYEFSVLRNAGDFYPDLIEELKQEIIVIQGKLDCAFFEDDGFVLIDYKTDNINDEEHLVSLYRGQLEVYKSALEECEGEKVKEIYLYSFKMKKFIEVK